jgi:hypothetical protein
MMRYLPFETGFDETEIASGEFSACSNRLSAFRGN